MKMRRIAPDLPCYPQQLPNIPLSIHHTWLLFSHCYHTIFSSHHVIMCSTETISLHPQNTVIYRYLFHYMKGILLFQPYSPVRLCSNISQADSVTSSSYLPYTGVINQPLRSSSSAGPIREQAHQYTIARSP